VVDPVLQNVLKALPHLSLDCQAYRRRLVCRNDALSSWSKMPADVLSQGVEMDSNAENMMS
jgi:hypothetical protein